MPEPFISVVTPFHNTASYLAQCIESVLAQTYSNFEYILADNCSSDGSGEIAARYASQDARIRLIKFSELVPQVPNYNRALQQISPGSAYCKIVQADDSIFPDCLNSMVHVFEKSESIGLVSSHDLKGDVIRGSGFPREISVMPGKDAARYYLRGGAYVFGSPTTVMYRSSLVRDRNPFYKEGLLHEDTEKCLEILEKWDFGFVHQVLSCLRTDNESISSSARAFQPGALDHYIILQRYAPVFFSAQESAELKKKSKREYYSVLAQQAIRLRPAAFWRYHQQGLRTLGERLDLPSLATGISKEFLWMLANPGTTVVRLLTSAKRSSLKSQSTRN
ncbi:MAG TPA: glycosyltransferase family 2 protein [Candidatus Acidoferrum sp.]|nr:glycosyltransferase family 2 protein [Candidatus Acidoferrum sp.]